MKTLNELKKEMERTSKAAIAAEELALLAADLTLPDDYDEFLEDCAFKAAEDYDAADAAASAAAEVYYKAGGE